MVKRMAMEMDDMKEESPSTSSPYLSAENLSTLHHFMSPALEEYEEEFYEGIPALKDGQVYACVCCEFTTSQDNLLMSHFESHMSSDPFELEEKHLEDVLKCKYCAQPFLKLKNLSKHECAHEEGRHYECSFCSKKFKNQQALNMHERTHLGIKLFSCRFCEKTFTWPSGLKVHERIHTGEKPYKCSFCSKTFSQGTSCKIHERTHTGVKPYKCSFCDYSSASAQNLNKHLKKHLKNKPAEEFLDEEQD